jgi:hypothetical protein
MIDFRCEQAGISNPFSKPAIQSIYTLTGGIPREILKTCAIGMEMMHEAGVTTIEPEMIEIMHKEAIYG